MRLCSIKRSVISFLLSAIAVGPIIAQEADDTVDSVVRPATDSVRVRVSTEPSPIFVEIELTAEGAVAYDSAGGRWAYDFDRLQFVAAPAEAGSERGRSEGGPDDQAPPVSERCTELKEVDNPALSAVYVTRDEYVDGDIVAYSRVTVKGWVKGNVRSINKAVLITSTGQVDGNVEAPEVEIREGGRVLGRVIETPTYEIPVDVITSGFSRAGLWVVFGFTLALALVAFLANSLAPQRLSLMTDCIRRFPLKSTLIGLLFVFLLPAIAFLICITIVGILVVWLLPIAYFVAFALGMCVIGYRLHEMFSSRFGAGKADTRIGSILGIGLFMGLWALTAVAWGSDDPSFKAGGLDVWLLVISILATCFPLLIGTGAAVLTRFGSRPHVVRRGSARAEYEPAPAPAPPPMPEAPTRFRPREPEQPARPGPLGRSEPGPDGISEN